MNEQITVGEAAELADLTPIEVTRFLNQGFVRPDIHISDGIGDPSILGPRNVRELALISKLDKSGLKKEVIRSILKTVNESTMNWWEEEGNYVVVMKEKWVVTDNPFSESNQKLFSEEGVLLLVEL